jgi:hypothetical protein
VSQSFDFEAWSRLWREDPQKFEEQRRAALDALIDAVPEAERQRLRGLQCRIDLERARARTALGACVRLNTLMWASLERLRVALQDLQSTGPDLAAPARAAAPRPADIIRFPGAHRTEHPRRLPRDGT